LIPFGLPPATLEIADGDIAAQNADVIVDRATRAAVAAAETLRIASLADVARELFAPPLGGFDDCSVSG
jgi:hypothetical protein